MKRMVNSVLPSQWNHFGGVGGVAVLVGSLVVLVRDGEGWRRRLLRPLLNAPAGRQPNPSCRAARYAAGGGQATRGPRASIRAAAAVRCAARQQADGRPLVLLRLLEARFRRARRA